MCAAGTAVSSLRNTRQTAAHNSAASSAKTIHAAPACHCHETMALASRPLATMPAPGPANITPPRAAAWRAASCARHQPDDCTST